MKATRTCSDPDCDRDARTRGMCHPHYYKAWRRGIELLPVQSPAERLAARLVEMPNGCLEITSGYTDKDGYGWIKIKGKMARTHRLAWTLANGPIPDDLHVLHHCDNPPCCQTDPTEGYPDGHLFLGTVADNMADRDAKGRYFRHTNGNEKNTHCPSNHPYDEVNTYHAKTGRVCRKCRLAAQHRYLSRRTSSPFQ